MYVYYSRQNVSSLRSFKNEKHGSYKYEYQYGVKFQNISAKSMIRYHLTNYGVSKT